MKRGTACHLFRARRALTLHQLVGIESPGDDVVRADAEWFQMRSDAARKRDARFSLRVLPAYNFTCALTRYQLVSVDGKTAMDAAHIHQYEKGGPDDPRNGLALSKTAHGLFDRGFWSIENDYTVLVKVDRFDEAGGADQLLKRRMNQTIHLPVNRQAWPGHEYLAWHRNGIGSEGQWSSGGIQTAAQEANLRRVTPPIQSPRRCGRKGRKKAKEAVGSFWRGRSGDSQCQPVRDEQFEIRLR
jgi:hypothetical protein